MSFCVLFFLHTATYTHTQTNSEDFKALGSTLNALIVRLLGM